MRTLGSNIAIFSDSKVLLTKREDFHVWCLPGGGIEAGESFVQACKRETREETGLDVCVERLVGIYSRPKWGLYHIMVFAGCAIEDREPFGSEEVEAIAYFGVNELPAELLLGQRQRILDAFANQPRPFVRVENFPWPFERPMAREELYRRRDESGLSRLEFYQRFIAPAEEHGSAAELDAPP